MEGEMDADAMIEEFTVGVKTLKAYSKKREFLVSTTRLCTTSITCHPI